MVKKVALVPSGPTKLKGPEELLLAAAWNLTVVFAGVDAVHDSVVQVVVAPATTLLSLSEDARFPDGWYVVGVMKVWKAQSDATVA